MKKLKLENEIASPKHRVRNDRMENEIASPKHRVRNDKLEKRGQPSISVIARSAATRQSVVAVMAIVIGLFSPVRAEQKNLSLNECYELALKQSEKIAIHQEQFAEIEAQLEASFASIKPKLDFVSSDKWQDSSANNGSQFTIPHTPERKFMATQPLFSGFKEFAAIDASKAQRRQREFELTQAKQLLFNDVSDAFYFLLEQRGDLDVLKETRKALGDRIDELNERVDVGKSRSAEVDTAQTQLHRLDGDIELIKGQEKNARQLLEFLTGQSIDQITDPLTSLPTLSPLDTYTGKAQQRPDVSVTAEVVHIAEKQITYAKGDYYPTASAQGDYFTQRAGVLNNIDWDVFLLVDVPIYKGGAVKANVKGAQARLAEARLMQQQTLRSATLEISNNYATVEAALNRTTPLQLGVESATRSHKSQVKDYRNGLVNNLDVLQALQSLQDVRRDSIRAQNEVKRLYWKLRVSTGEYL